MSGEIDIVVDQMNTHASKLDDVASSGQEGVDAGESVTTNGDAYGVMCQFIGAALLPVQTAGIVNSRAAVTSLTGTANAVRTVAKTIETTDELVSEPFKIFTR